MIISKQTNKAVFVLKANKQTSKTILGRIPKAQSPRVKASQGFYYSGFIQPNKQTNKHEWKRSRGFTVGVLFNKTNKQTNEQDRLG